MGVSMAPPNSNIDVLNLANQMNPAPAQMGALAEISKQQAGAGAPQTRNMVENLKRNEVQQVIMDLIEFKKDKDAGKYPAGFVPPPEKLQEWHQSSAPHLSHEEFDSILTMYKDVVSPAGPDLTGQAAPPTVQSGEGSGPLSKMLEGASGGSSFNLGAQAGAGAGSMPQEASSPTPAPINTPQAKDFTNLSDVLVAALSSLGHPLPNQGELLNNAMQGKVMSGMKGMEISNEAEAKRNATIVAAMNAGKERSQLVKVRNPEGKLEQIWLQVGQPLPAGYKPDEAGGVPKSVYDENKGLWALMDNDGKITSYLPKGVKPQAERTTEIRVSGFANQPAPSFMPPGYVFNRPKGEYIWKGKGPAPEGTYQQQAADWTSLKKALGTANSPRVKMLASAGTALFEGSKDAKGKTVTEPILSKLVRLRNEMPDSYFSAWSNQVKLFNSWDQLIAWNVSDPKFAELKSSAIAAAERMGQIYQGGVGATSDAKLKLAQQLLDYSLGKEAFSAVVQGHGRDLQNTVNTYVQVKPVNAGGEIPFTEPYTAPGPTTPAPAAPGLLPVAPSAPGALTPEQEAANWRNSRKNPTPVNPLVRGR